MALRPTLTDGLPLVESLNTSRREWAARFAGLSRYERGWQ